MPNQNSHPWTSEELGFLEQNIRKLTYKQMAVFINRSPFSIQSKIRYLPFQQKVKKHAVNSDFFKRWSPKMAYTLGFIAADGNICHSGKTHVLHIACDDRDVVEKIKVVLDYAGPIYQKGRPNGKISYSLRICDPIIFNDLQKLNITERKSLTFKPPVIPVSYVRHFVRGYFDGDGSISFHYPYGPKRLRAIFYTASEGMALFLHSTMADVLGDLYKANISVKLAHQKTKYYAIMMGHYASIMLFKYMYDNESLFLERKYKKFLEGINGD